MHIEGLLWIQDVGLSQVDSTCGIDCCWSRLLGLRGRSGCRADVPQDGVSNVRIPCTLGACKLVDESSYRVVIAPLGLSHVRIVVGLSLTQVLLVHRAEPVAEPERVVVDISLKVL